MVSLAPTKAQRGIWISREWTYFDDFIRASSGQGTLINIKTTMHLLYLSIYKLASYLVAQSTTYFSVHTTYISYSITTYSANTRVRKMISSHSQ